MDFLNRALLQLNDLFKSMTIGARITAALLLAVVLISVGFLFQTGTSGPDSYLLGGHAFIPSEMAAVQGALAKAGLGDFEVDGNQIRIPRNQQSAYIAALADEKLLPQSFGDRLMTTVENQSPFASGVHRDSILKHARDSMLAKSISGMRGIESAEVYTDTKQSKGLHSETIATATVNVRTAGGLPLTTERVQAIRSLVAGAIAGLPREKISVIDSLAGRHWSGEGGDGSAGGLDDPYLSRKSQYEEQFESDITALLSYVPGVAVSVNVELNKERNRREESQKYDPKAIVPVRTTSEDSESSSESSAPGGRPGFEAQQPNRGAQLSGGRGNTTRDTRGRSETANLPSTEITRSDHVGLTPEKVTVSVVVPVTYFEDIWRRNNPPAAGQQPRQPTSADLTPIEEAERQRIQNAVYNQIPHGEAPATELVSVTAFTPIPLATAPAPGVPALAASWLAQYWSTLGMLGLAGVSLLFLRSMMNAVPVPQETPATPVFPRAAGVPETATAAADKAEASAKSRLRRRVSNGPSLRDDLVELVRDDPDSAANILKGWIGSVN